MAKNKRVRRKKKRRFEAAGALVLGRARTKRRPAASRVASRRKRRAQLLLLGVVLAGALWVAVDDRFYVYGADVVGAVRVSRDEIFWASDLAGLHILWTRSVEVEANILAALPNVESVDAGCGFPADCTITVVERQPKVMWDENGTFWWIDADGVIFQAPPASPSTGGEEWESWAVRGPLPRDGEGRLEERVRVGLAELWATGEDVAVIFDYVPSRGLVFVDERGWRVILGQGPGMAKRIQVLERLTDDLEARGLIPRFIDVRFADVPYYSLTNDW